MWQRARDPAAVHFRISSCFRWLSLWCQSLLQSLRAADVIELWEVVEESFPLVFQPVQVEVKSYPANIIKALPPEDCRIFPQPFVEISKAELEKVGNLWISEFEIMNKCTTQEWKEFLNIYPHHDNVMSYSVQAGPLELPHFYVLFKRAPFFPTVVHQGDKWKAWEAKKLNRYQAELSLGHERGTVPTRLPSY